MIQPEPAESDVTTVISPSAASVIKPASCKYNRD